MTGITRRGSLASYAALSIAAALATMGLKLGAWWWTGSVGLLSDALESLVNLAAALIALWVLVASARPPDDDHDFGHEKAEFFASAAEGVLILVAAWAIACQAWERLQAPQPLEAPGLGLAATLAASLVNLGVARVLLRAGREHGSVALEADARHLLTDVWTSAGVIGGVGLAALTGRWELDPLVALAVGAHILVTGASLVRRSAQGLMDPALPPGERGCVETTLRERLPESCTYHALRTRQAGPRRYVSVHILVPGEWSVLRGHQLLEEIEEAIRGRLPGAIVFTHLEPLEDPSSFQDVELFMRGIPKGPSPREANIGDEPGTLPGP